MGAQKKYSTRAAVEAAKRQLFGHKLMRRQLLLSNKNKKKLIIILKRTCSSCWKRLD